MGAEETQRRTKSDGEKLWSDVADLEDTPAAEPQQKKSYLQVADPTKTSAWHAIRRNAYINASASSAAASDPNETAAKARKTEDAAKIAEAATNALAATKATEQLKAQQAQQQAQHAAEVEQLKQQVAAATTTANAAANTDTHQVIIKDAKARFTEQDKKHNEFVERMKSFNQQIQTDQCELRDKIKAHAHEVGTQINEFKQRMQGLYQIIEGQATQLQTLHDTVNQLSNTFAQFTSQQLAAQAVATAATTALTTQQTKMFEMLEALQNRAISSEPSEKKPKIADKSNDGS